MPPLLSALAVPLGTASFGAKAAFGFSLAAASVTAAGAAGVLPEPVQHTVASVVRAVSPFEIPDPADHRGDVGHRVGPDSGDDAGPTTQPDHTPSPSGDLPVGAPEEGSGGGSETPPTTQPATASTTRPAGIPTGRR